MPRSFSSSLGSQLPSDLVGTGEFSLQQIADEASHLLQIAQLVGQAKAQLQEEKIQTMAELKRKTGVLAIAIAEKILAEKIDSKKDAAIIERAVNAMSKEPVANSQ